MSLNDWITEQEKRGITTFSFQKIRNVFSERSEKTLKTDINRLVVSKRIQFVYKGFYVIIPTQYQLKGIVPPSYYINELMDYLGKPYYIGLLSAAALYGASHQRAMVTQIVTIGPRPRTSNKNTLLNWNYRMQIPNELLESRNAEMGRINYSSAELTAVDIVQFASNIGGYQRASTVLAELVDMVDVSKIEGVLPYTTTTTLQRLGYLLEFVLFEQEKADELYAIMKKQNGYFNAVLMSSEQPSLENAESNRWRINMNIDIEIDEL
ncbi:MAG: type IV toxin-antitoxin system AbiEi family antitoxin [Bacteroidales bacterium]|nr:type IV toxin-antitoxin system AbiEi family antitoxin [Bacteroidales bacterium]